MSPSASTTRILLDIGEGDSSAARDLLPLVYEELRSLAAGHLQRERAGHTLQPTALAHERPTCVWSTSPKSDGRAVPTSSQWPRR